MQTFLPYPGQVHQLDDRRLFNQFNEHAVIWCAVVYGAKPWHNHPACVMWRGRMAPGARWTADTAPYGRALADYGLLVHRELKRRGLRWGVDHYDRLMRDIELHYKHAAIVYPPWHGHPAFHLAHRRNLVRKDPVFYASLGVPPDDTYVWPIQRDDGVWELRTKRVGVRDYQPGERLALSRTGSTHE